MTTGVKLGLKENWKQFALLIIINAFVGGMVGLERTILPEIAEKEFHLALKTAILSFIVVFGTVKAITNYFAGSFANKMGRKKLLVIGWLFGLPVPFILMFATNWNWVLVANVFLGINQGLAWSSTVVMKIDLVGEKNRGFAMGLNEFSGYLAVAVVAFLTSQIALNYGMRPFPFYIGIGLVFLGLIGSWIFVKDTNNHVSIAATESKTSRLQSVFWETTISNKNLSAITQAGLVNNLNDGMVWGLFPIFLLSKGFNFSEIGSISAIYPAVWGIGQLFTGTLSDRFAKRTFLFWGMLLQGMSIVGLLFANGFIEFALLSALLGWGTAMVYPTFLSSIALLTHPIDRAKSIGVFRLWRDLGYAIGAVATGIIADFFGAASAIYTIGGLTILSAIIIRLRMHNI